MPQPTDTDEIREPFRRWLTKLWADVTDLTIGDFGGAATGYSAQTLIVPVSYTRDGGRVEDKVVLRIENPGDPIYPAQAPGLDVEIDIQYRAMHAVGPACNIPLAPLIGYEGDARVLGAPFFVMGFIGGEVPVLEPMYTQAGFFFDGTPDQRRHMVEAGIAVMAEIHTVDWKKAGLDWLIPAGVTPGTLQQIDVWERYLRAALGERVNPVADQALAWLRANVPAAEEITLSWGDARPGNIIWQDFEPACVTDWENVSIATPMLDLGWWLMFDRTCHDTMGIERLPGEPSLDEQRDYYARITGRDISNVDYYVLLAAVRYVAIITRMMNLYVDKGQLPADQTLWIENPPQMIAAELVERLT
jgi:aminoglycoside phosphotransferase (APT) family kinase protein